VEAGIDAGVAGLEAGGAVDWGGGVCASRHTAGQSNNRLRKNVIFLSYQPGFGAPIKQAAGREQSAQPGGYQPAGTRLR
jgi:hypothetical protein